MRGYNVLEEGSWWASEGGGRVGGRVDGRRGGRKKGREEEERETESSTHRRANDRGQPRITQQKEEKIEMKRKEQGAKGKSFVS